MAQITGGNDTVQDAIRFEKQKDAADARQARIEAQRREQSSADRSAPESKQQPATRRHRAAKGTAARGAPAKQ